MDSYRVAIIGTGRDPENPTVEGFAMGYRHAEAYRGLANCEVVACADIVPENATAFATEFGIPDRNVYEDHNEMLRSAAPDIVSVTVPPKIHQPVVVDCASAETVKAIHCEKPMAHTWSSAQQMAQTCWRHDTQLTFNRQRRYGKPFSEAKRLIDDGEIGEMERIEIGWGDFYDTGAHTVDLAGMFNDDRPAEWVIAQLDYRDEDIRFGNHQENQISAQWRYTNGVYGLATTGKGMDMIDAAMLVRGSEGIIRINVQDGPMLEVERRGERRRVDVDGETMHVTGSESDDRFGSAFHERAIEDVIKCLETGADPQLGSRIGLNTEEILFGAYESVRKRGRVDFPLKIADNPLEQVVESGALTPK